MGGLSQKASAAISFIMATLQKYDATGHFLKMCSFLIQELIAKNRKCFIFQNVSNN
jgi:hypothetical protein